MPACSGPLTALEDLVRRANAAWGFLQHALDCPAEHPVRECPYLRETLDRQVAGWCWKNAPLTTAERST